jgi:hypothetical protein
VNVEAAMQMVSALQRHLPPCLLPVLLLLLLPSL